MDWKLPALGVLIGIVLDFVVPFWGIPVVGAIGAWWIIGSSLPARDPADGAGGARLWGLSGFVVVAAVCGIHFALITRGTGHPLGEELLGSAFDSLASSLLAASAEVAPEAIRWEAMEVDGRTYMYFGMWPALLRIPLDWFVPANAGQWSKSSCFLASLLTVAGFGRIAARRLVHNDSLDAEDKRFFLAVSVLGFGLATPLAYLMHTGTIYHEPIIWGLCGSVWGIYFLFRLLEPIIDSAPAIDLRSLFGLSSVAGATLLARVTYGAPLYLVLACVCGFALYEALRDEARDVRDAFARLAIGVTPAVACLLLQLWYNFDRFGSPLTFVDYQYVAYVVNDPQSSGVMQRTGPFDLGRLWNGFVNYFGFRAANFHGDFPWVRVAHPSYPEADLYSRIFRSHLVSLSVVSSWIVAGASIGAFHLFTRPASLLARLCGLAFLVQLVVVMSFFIMEQRYSLDFFPFLIFAYAYFLAGAATVRPLRGRPKDLATVLLFLVAISTVATLSSTLSGITSSGPGLPEEYRARWGERFERVDSFFGRDAAPPRRAPSAGTAPTTPQEP
jgi:hypothetical protein